jgi:hypothetical protein
VAPYSPGETADRLAIYDLCAHDVHAVDEHRLDILDTIFLPDTTFDMTSLNHGMFVWGSDPQSGMQADYQNNWHNFAIYFHSCGSVCIDFDNAVRNSAHVKSKTPSTP